MVHVYHRFCCLTLVLAGCDIGILFGGDEATTRQELGTGGGYRDVDTLVVGRAADALETDPARARDNESAEVIMQIYDRLLHYPPGSNQPQAGLAVSWEVEDGGRSWTFELRRNVVFHDGTRLDADAVVLSFERQLDPAHRFHEDNFFYWQNYFGNVVSIEKLDTYRVRIVIEEEYAPFLANMSIFSMGVISPTALEQHGADITRFPVGTGPFKFVSWNEGRIALERNESYWGEPARFRRLIFETIPDPRQRLVALESGAIDVALGVLPEEMQFVELHPRLRLHKTGANSVTYLALNCDREPFNDVNVRRAVNYAINKNPIVEVLWQGMADPANSPLPPTSWAHHETVDPYTYSPDKARALLTEAARDGRFDPSRTYRLFVPSTPRQYMPSPIRLGRAIQANLRDVGLSVDLVVQAFEVHGAATERGQHDLCLDGWVGDTGDPDNFLNLLLDSDNADAKAGSASNVAFFRDPQVHHLLTYAQRTQDRSERARHYKDVQALVHQWAPWVPLAHSMMGIATRSDIANVHVNLSGLIDYRQVTRTTRRSRGGR